MPDDLKSVQDIVFTAMSEDDFAGHDPFDYLNSPLARTAVFNYPLVRLAWLQLGKRLPFNLRGILRIPKQRNAKGLALVILGLIEDYKRGRSAHCLELARELGDWLINNRCDLKAWKHSAWGYNFDWQARAFFVPRGTPNVISTTYVARALFTLGQYADDSCYGEVAEDAASFIVESLLISADDRSYFAYIPGETAIVHNASLWGACMVGMIGVRRNNSSLVDLALEVARNSVREQKEDGSWEYGKRSHHRFIDGFHTGYNLEALNNLRAAVVTDEFDEAIDKGMGYYRNNFFLSDGTAKYYNDNKYPLDLHNYAQAILTLLSVGDTNEDRELAALIVENALKTMFISKRRCFAYQKYPLYTNRINYLRWTQAWAFYSLAFYNRYLAEISGEKN
jgi:hypothetical protein